MIRAWVAVKFWLRAVAQPRSVRRQIDAEIEYHVSMRARELEGEGLDAREARRLALEMFGQIERVKSQCREQYMVDSGRGEGRMFRDIVQDVRFGLRSMGRQPVFAVAVVLTLGLGIGVNSAIFSVLHGVLLSPLPYEEPTELVRLWQADRVNGTRFENFSGPDYFDVFDRSSSFSAAAAVELRSPTLTSSDDTARRLTSVAATHGLLDALGVRPTLGRWFSVDEAAPGGDHVAVLGHGLWISRFGGDPRVIGRAIHLDGILHEVVGVVGPTLEFPQSDVQVWVPLQVDRDSRPRSQHNFRVIARLADEVSIEQANAGLGVVATALAAEYPVENEGREMWAQSLHESVVGDVASALYLLAGGVGLVLLIACVNVANLLFVRASGRAHEVAVRLALGAGRTRLLRQLLTENVLLSLIGGGLGLVLSVWGVRVLVGVGAGALPRATAISVDAPVLAFTAAITLATGLLCGLSPALRGVRGRFRTSLVGGTQASARGLNSGRLGRLLVVAEVTMAVVLVSTAGLLFESFSSLQRVDPGYDPAGVLSASMELPLSRYSQPRPEWPNYPEVLGFQHDLVARALDLPGVTGVGLAMNGPTDPGWTTAFSAELVAAEDVERTEEVRIRIISSGYPEAIGMELVRGRLPNRTDDLFESPPVALVNQAMVDDYFGGVDPIGSWISNWGTRREIIGIVRDVRFMGRGLPAEPAVYPLFAHMPLAAFSILLRTSGDPADLAGPLRDVVAQIDPNLAIGAVGAVDEMLAESTGQARLNALLLSLFAALSLLLAAVGMYGVISYGVSRRRHEIGVRLSLGASRTSVAGHVVADSLALTVVGLLLGLAIAVGSAELLTGLLYGVEPLDVSNLLRVVALSGGVGLFAAYVPARRASRVDPVRAVTGR